MLTLFLGEKTARLTRGQAGRGMACALDVRDDRTNRDALRGEFHIENGALAVVRGDLETARGFVVLVRVHPVVEARAMGVAWVEFFVPQFACDGLVITSGIAVFGVPSVFHGFDPIRIHVHELVLWQQSLDARPHPREQRVKVDSAEKNQAIEYWRRNKPSKSCACFTPA
jgi:hypothetical protein